MLGQPEFQANAKLAKNGEVSVKVTASVGYGSQDGDGNFARTASKSVDVEVDEKTSAALTKALTTAIKDQTMLGQEVAADAAEGISVATKKGEVL